MEAPAPKHHVSPPGIWVTKLILRILSLVFCIAIAGLGGALTSSSIVESFFFLVIGPPVFVALAWDIAEGICILARGGHRGIHPGACVGVDLILWLGLVACTTLVGLLGIATSAYSYSYDYYSYYDDLYYDGDLQDVIAKGRAILGLSGTLTVVHFVVFVIACYETNERNRRPQTTYIVYTNTTQQAPAFGAVGGPTMVQQPQQVYYTQPGQPVVAGAGQPMMYYTYAQPPAQSPSAAVTTTPTPTTMTSPGVQTPESNFAIQPVPPPPVYSGRTGAADNKTELPS